MAFCTARRRSRSGRRDCDRKPRWQGSANPSPSRLPAPDRSSLPLDTAAFASGLFAASATSRGEFQHSEQEPEPASTSGHDVIDERIDVAAQFAILRMRARGGADGTAAAEALRRVKSDELGGIFGDDLGIAAKYGARLGKPRWELTGGRPAARVGPVDELPEAVFFRQRLRQDRDAMDEVIRFAAGRAGATPATGDDKEGACTPPDPSLFEVVETQEPRTFNSPRAGQNVDAPVPEITTHQPFAQFRWRVKVKLTRPASQCFEVGFLQTVRENSIVARYESELGLPKLCFLHLPTPARDGPKDSPDAWFAGPAPLGTGCFTGLVAPPDLIPQNVPSTAVKMNDNPGQDWCVFRGLGDSCRASGSSFFPRFHLRRIDEHISFDAWLAVRPKGAAGFDKKCYTLLRFARWVKDRTTLVTPGAQIGASATGGPRLLARGAGAGGSTPDMTAQAANQRAVRFCIP